MGMTSQAWILGRQLWNSDRPAELKAIAEYPNAIVRRHLDCEGFNRFVLLASRFKTEPKDKKTSWACKDQVDLARRK